MGGHFFRCLAHTLSHSWGLSCTEPVTTGCSFLKKKETNLCSGGNTNNTSRRWISQARYLFQTAVESPALDTLSDKHSEAEQGWKKKKLHPWGRNKSVEDGYSGTHTVPTFPRKILILIASFSHKLLAVLLCKLPVSKKLKKKKKKKVDSCPRNEKIGPTIHWQGAKWRQYSPLGAIVVFHPAPSSQIPRALWVGADEGIEQRQLWHHHSFSAVRWG